MSKQKSKSSSRRKPATLRASKPRKGSSAKAPSVSRRTATKHDRVLALLRSAGENPLAERVPTARTRASDPAPAVPNPGL
jgi:hypothetical protein